MKRMKRKLLTLMLAGTMLTTIALPAAAAELPQTSEFCGQQLENRDLEWLRNCLADLWQNCGGQLPECPEAPVMPDEPETPDVPTTPEEPDTPSEPEQPEVNGTVSAMEQQVVALVNAERAKYGLAALTLSTELSNGARLKSQDMAEQNYFSHTSPTYGSPFEMMKTLGISYRSAGENIAKGYSTAAAVMEGWMNSEGHRANILNSSYTEIGVGYVADGNYWTQWFRS